MNLWVDDMRDAPDATWWIARNYADAIRLLQTKQVSVISLDHDLGEERSGYDVACWIEDAFLLHRVPPPEIRIHTANPVGRARIQLVVGSIERQIANLLGRS